MDFIGKFENLNEDYLKVCKILDFEPQELHHLKKSNRKPYKEYYTDKTKKTIEVLYATDIQHFGYEF